MYTCTKTFKLNTGAQIPAIGLGTWRTISKEVTKEAIISAIKAGYRHIDTADVYGNEAEIGEALKEAFDSNLVKREELFITTKLWNGNHRTVEEGLEGSLQRLGLDYVDLYLMHWPIPLKKIHDADGKLVKMPQKSMSNYLEFFDTEWNYLKTWKKMETLIGSGKVKAIGVSNFTPKRLAKLVSVAKVIPACNQVQLHPLLPEIELFELAEKHGILLEAYSPLGSDNAPLLKHEFVNELAKKHNIPPANVIFSWCVQRGIIVLPKSAKPERIASNIKVFDLPQEDVDALTNWANKNGGPKRLGTSTWLKEDFWDDVDVDVEA